MEAVREYCQRKPVMLEKMKHLQRDQVYRQQLVSNIVRIQALNINWCLGNLIDICITRSSSCK